MSVDERRVRTIPPGLLVAAAATLASGIGAGWVLRPPALLIAGSAGLALIAAAASGPVLGWRRVRPVCWLLLILALGLLRGGVAAAPGAGLAQAMDGPGTIRGSVGAAPVAYRGEVVVTLDVDESSAVGAPTGVVALALLGRSDLLPGDRVEVQVSRLRAPDDRPGPLSSAALARQGVDAVAVSPRLTLLARGGPGLARAVAAARAGVAAEVDAAVAEPDADLLDAVAFGIHRPLPATLTRPLQDAGLAHLEATSGLKVVVAAGLIARLLLALRLGRRPRLVARFATIAAFVLLAGGGAAAFRSALMASAGTLLRGDGRRVTPRLLLALVTVGMLMVEPRLSGDLGFQMSVLGTLGIVELADPIAARLPGPRLVTEPLALTVAAQLLTIPVQAEAFGTVSLVGPLANAVALPLLPAVIALAWPGAALGALSPALGGTLLSAAGWVAGLIDGVARAAAAVPGAAIHPASWPRAWSWCLGLVALIALVVRAATQRRGPGNELDGSTAAPAEAPARGALLAAARDPSRRPSRRLILASVGAAAAVVLGAVTVTAARPDGRMHLSVLDVGAGTAVLVRTASGGLALIDSGPDPQRLLSALGGALPPLTHTLDMLVLTGGERAATAGLADIAAHYVVTRAVVPDAPLGTAARAAVLALRDTGTSVEVVPVGAVWTWAGAQWRCAGPRPPDDPPAQVLPACALQVADGTGSALVLGDMAAPAQEELAAIGGAGLRSDLVVTPPSGLLAPALAASARPTRLAVPCARAPRTRLDRAAERTTAEDGTLAYAGGDAGLEPA